MSLSAPVMAAPLSADELLNQFNLITFGNFTARSEVEGRTYVGGDLIVPHGTNFNIYGQGGQTPASEYDELIVGGSIRGDQPNSGQLQLNNGGDATVGGSVSNAFFNLNAGSGQPSGTLRAGGSISATVNIGTALANQPQADIAARMPQGIEATLKATSAAVRDLGGTVPVPVEGKRYTLNGSTGVYALSLADLASANNEFVLQGVNAANPLMINVSGTSGDVRVNFGNLFAQAPFLLWNFYEATQLHFETQFFGSILAPLAHVTNQTPIEGTLVAKTANLNGEMHLRPFEGNVPVIPVPATLPLIASAIAGLALLRRRSRAAA